MKKIAILIIALAVLQLICMPVWAANLKAAKPFTIGTRSSRTMEVQFKIPDFEIEKELVSGKVWDKIQMEDSGYLIEPGMPELPVLSTTIAIPSHGQVEIELINTRTKMIQHIIPYPSQDGNIDDTPKGFSVNQAFYSSTEVYPQEVIKYSDPQIIRDFRIVTIQVQPFAWNATTQELEVREEIDFRLRFNDTPGINELSEPLTISPSFANIYESIILNFDDYRSALVANTPPRYLLIHGNYADATFLSYINEFAFWKRQKGADVSVVSTAISGSSNNQIKAYIQNAYNNINTRPDFIILVGDTSGSFPIPTWPESFSSYSGQGDYPYQHLAGNDYLGDVFLGRISAENTSQLDVILSKIYHYEKNLTINSAQWLNKMLLVGDTAPSGQSCYYINKYVKDVALHYNPDYTFTELYSGDPSPTQMNQAMNLGVGFFNYRGYIGMSGWSPSTSLINGVKLPHAVIITCSTGTFYSGESTTEKFIRLGTASVPAGAVTAIGMATSGTHTMFNNSLTAGIFNGIFTHNMRTMGEALLNGKLVMDKVYSQAHANTVKYFAHWCNLMGDPTMEVYCKVPDTFTAHVPATLPMGTGSLDLTILNQYSLPVKDACVTISQSDSIIVRGYTDANGYVYLLFDAVLSASNAVVTVSRHEFKPLQSTININSNGSLVAGVSVIDDDNTGNSVGNGNLSANSGETLEVTFSILNSTNSVINNVTGYVTCDNPYVIVTDSLLNFNNIAAGASANSIIPLLIQIASDCPNRTVLHFDMHLTDIDSSVYLIPNFITVTDAFLNFAAYDVVDGDNHVLDPMETADFTVTISNSGTVPANDLYSQLVSQNPLVQVIDSLAYFGNILAGSQVSASADMFQIKGRPQLVPGMLIPMRLKLYNLDGFLQWLDFTITIGVITQTSPLGPDAFGHIIYDVNDLVYEDCPTFDWIGIAPAEGGHGTQLSITDTGTTSDEGDVVDAQSLAVVSLPFNFIFYGRSYNQITVCSNGFIAMGITENANYRNFHLPGAAAGGGGAPSPLIAPFWDDLITTGGGIYKWYNAADHYFVIEWYNCKNGRVQTAVETFQVILYDPVYYPTTLGDGPVKIQYQTFNNVDTGSTSNEYSGNYCTIGIQNLEQTDGLEYSFNNIYPVAAAPLSSQKALYITTIPAYQYTPHLVYDSAYILDDNNNVVEPGETVDLYVNIHNIGEQTAYNVDASIASTSPYVTIVSNYSNYPSIEGDSLGINTTPYRFTVAQDCPDNQLLPFTMTIGTATDFWQRTFNLEVQKPGLVYWSYLINDLAGNNNGVADPGESIIIAVNAQNNSLVDAHNLTGLLSSSLLGINISDPIETKPLVAAGEIMQFTYHVSISAGIPVGSNVPFNFNLVSADAPTVDQNLHLTCGTSGTILDFESADSYLISQGGWELGTPTQTTPHSGTNLWCTGLTGYYENNANYILTTPPVTLGTNVTLSFWHYMFCQNYFDGGNVSISANGGTNWSLLYPTNGYNTSLNISALGEVGYTNLVSWSQVTFDLSQYANTEVIIRWRFASNSSGQGLGWFIDDVLLSGNYVTPGIVTGNVTLNSGMNPRLVKLKTNNNLVTNPDSTGAYIMYLPQATYTLSASLPYHTVQISPEFSLSNQMSAYSYDFTLSYLDGPSGLEYSGAIGDSVIYLTWVEPTGGMYPVLHYNIYRRFADHPFQLLGQTTDNTFSEVLYDDGVYTYYVAAEYSVGEGAPSNSVLVAFPFTNTGIEPTPVVVNALHANYPNPFNPTTTLSFSLAKAGNVSLRIYNTRGQLVNTLVNNAKSAGEYKVVWNGKSSEGRPVSSGLYFYKLDAPGYSKTRKMMLLK